MPIRIIMFIAVVLLVIALVANLSATAVLGVADTGWLIGGLLVWAIDVLIGGYVVTSPARRVQ